MTAYFIDHAIRPLENGSIDLKEAQKISTWVIGALALTYLFRELFIWLRLKTMAVVGEYVATDLRKDLYRHMQKLGIDFFGSKHTGSLISRVTSDTDRLWDFVAFGVIEVFVSVLMLFGIGGVLLYMDWRLGLIMVAPVPVFLYAIYWHGESMQKVFLRIWRKWSRMTGLVSDTLPGMKVVKAFNRGSREEERFDKRNAEVLGEAETLHQMWTSFWPKLMFMIQFCIVAVWYFAAPRLLSSLSGQVANPLSVGTFVAFMLYAGLFIHPIEIIGQMARMMNRALSSAHRVFEILDTQPSHLEKSGGDLHSDEIRGNITLENVRFSYDGVRPVLKGVSLDIKQGEMIGLVGPSGSGKSTLVQLLIRFYDVNGGSLKVDGVDLRNWDMNAYRSQVAMVLQEPYLFHGTLLDNIRYGKPNASLKKVVEAARTANAHDFIMRLPQAYDTMVGERGHTLSGGERQRISIARAILQDPRLLILDEATSAVDTETERKIQDALDKLVKGRTVVAIAHRLSTLAQADRIVCLKDGQVVEVGTHEKLLETKDSLYRKLYNLQIDRENTMAV